MELVMNRKNAIAIALMGILLSAGAATSASASPWTRHHPRRAEVNARLMHQNLRIDREGKITGMQARDLHAEDRGIRAEERYDASKDGSHITRREDRTLNHQENAVSGQIGR
jgi:hypothetical protein